MFAMTVTDRFLKVTILSDIEERQETRFSAALRGQSRRKANSLKCRCRYQKSCWWKMRCTEASWLASMHVPM